MGRFKGKVIGAWIGGMLGGPLGVLIGGAIGHYVKDMPDEEMNGSIGFDRGGFSPTDYSKLRETHKGKKYY